MQWMPPGIPAPVDRAWSDDWSESPPNRWSSQSSSPSWSPGFRTATHPPSDLEISPPSGPQDLSIQSLIGNLSSSSTVQPSRNLSRVPPRLTLQPPLSPPYTSPSYVNLEPPSSPSLTQLAYHVTDMQGVASKNMLGLRPPSISLHPPMSPGSPRWPPTPPRASPHLGIPPQQQTGGTQQQPHFNFQTLSVPSMLALLPTPPASPMSPRYAPPGSPMMASKSGGSSGLQTPMLSPGSPRQHSLGMPMVSSPRASPFFFGTSTASLMPACAPRSRSHSPSPIS